MEEQKKILERESASIRLERFGGRWCCQYELTTPFPLSQEQQELILQMIRQMKHGRPWDEPIELIWIKERGGEDGR